MFYLFSFSLRIIIYNEFIDRLPFFTLQNSKSFVWPDIAVKAVVALEKASHDTFSPNFQNYSEKIQNLAFNLKVRSYFF